MKKLYYPVEKSETSNNYIVPFYHININLNISNVFYDFFKEITNLKILMTSILQICIKLNTLYINILNIFFLLFWVLKFNDIVIYFLKNKK